MLTLPPIRMPATSPFLPLCLCLSLSLSVCLFHTHTHTLTHAHTHTLSPSHILCLFSKRLLMIPRCCPLISELQLTGCFKVTDAVMAMVVDELRLQRFAISSSSNIANKTLAALAKQTGSLMGCFVLCFVALLLCCFVALLLCCLLLVACCLMLCALCVVTLSPASSPLCTSAG